MRLSLVARKARRARRLLRDNPEHSLLAGAAFLVFLQQLPTGSTLSDPDAAALEVKPPPAARHPSQAHVASGMSSTYPSAGREAPDPHAEAPKDPEEQDPHEHEHEHEHEKEAARARSDGKPTPSSASAAQLDSNVHPEPASTRASDTPGDRLLAPPTAFWHPPGHAAEVEAPAAAPAGRRSRQTFAPIAHPGGPIGPDAQVASFEVRSTGEGAVFLSATARVRTPNWSAVDGGDASCTVEARISDTLGFTGCAPGENCRLEGYVETRLRGSLPEGQTDGDLLSAWQTASRVLPLKEGVNTFYLVGRTNCSKVVWGTVTLGLLQVE